MSCLIKPLFLAADLGKPFKDYPHLLSNSIADRIQVCPSAISAASPQTSLLSTTLSSVHSTRPNSLYFVSFHHNCVSSTKAHLKTHFLLIHHFNQNLTMCKSASIRVSHSTVAHRGPEVPQEFEG